MALGEWFLEIAVRLCSPGWSSNTWLAFGDLLEEMRKDFNAEKSTHQLPDLHRNRVTRKCREIHGSGR